MKLYYILPYNLPDAKFSSNFESTFAIFWRSKYFFIVFLERFLFKLASSSAVYKINATNVLEFQLIKMFNLALRFYI